MSKPTILNAAQAIRAELPNLLTPELAQQITETLETLLLQAPNNQSIENQITELLRQQEPTREWVKRYLKGENPDNKTKSASLPGNPTTIASTLYYKCTDCGKSLKSPQLGIIPKCPDHPTAQVITMTT